MARRLIARRHILAGVAAGLLLIGITYGFVQRSLDLHALREAQVTSQKALGHLCALQATTRVVWESAVASYASLPDRTLEQSRLLGVLRAGVAEIDADTTCNNIKKRTP